MPTHNIIMATVTTRRLQYWHGRIQSFVTVDEQLTSVQNVYHCGLRYWGKSFTV